jgi:hypothetical protein
MTLESNAASNEACRCSPADLTLAAWNESLQCHKNWGVWGAAFADDCFKKMVGRFVPRPPTEFARLLPISRMLRRFP